MRVVGHSYQEYISPEHTDFPILTYSVLDSNVCYYG